MIASNDLSSSSVLPTQRVNEIDDRKRNMQIKIWHKKLTQRIVESKVKQSKKFNKSNKI